MTKSTSKNLVKYRVEWDQEDEGKVKFIEDENGPYLLHRHSVENFLKEQNGR